MFVTLRSNVVGALCAAFFVACGARSELIGAVPSRDAALADAADSVDVFVPECTADRACNDDIACTRDRCTDGRCVHTADDSRCDDGLFCTVADRCDPQRGCVSAPRVCDDGVACTAERCDEFGNACLSEPDDRLCPISHRCDPMRGCIARVLATDRRMLYEVELPNALVRPIGRTSAIITDLALAPDRSLYGVGANQLFGIDARTGAATPIVPVMGDFTALDAAPDGTLYGGAGDRLVAIDPATGAVSTAGQYPPGLEASGDIAAYGNELLASARAMFNGVDSLVAFDIAAGTSRVVGSTNFRCVYGLAAFGTTLYGLTCEGQIITIDAATGAGTQIAGTSVSFYGATAR